jgi:hypothetical protein
MNVRINDHIISKAVKRVYQLKDDLSNNKINILLNY